MMTFEGFLKKLRTPEPFYDKYSKTHVTYIRCHTCGQRQKLYFPRSCTLEECKRRLDKNHRDEDGWYHCFFCAGSKGIIKIDRGESR